MPSIFAPRRTRRTLARVLTALAAVALPLALSMPGNAAAAVGISGCFSANGTMITGLSTDVQYLTVSQTWRALPGSRGSTDARGCVSYTIQGDARRYALRIHAAGVVPAWSAMVDGATPNYGRPGAGRYALGTSGMRVSYLSTSMTAAPGFGVDTSAWLNDMTDGGACSNNPSSAMLVACYMDRHGMHGNAVVLDYDHDGVEDAQDRYPRDARSW
jgi:hypothetical protein